MNFYLGVWNGSTAISDEEAATRYRELNEERSVEPEFDASAYKLYCDLISLFPEVETVPEDELDSCPWACGIDAAADHVIMAIHLEHAPKIIAQIVLLAAKYELVCFDPQAGKVYLPRCLEAKRAPIAAACASSPQPSVMEINTEHETSGGEGLHPNSGGILSEQ